MELNLPNNKFIIKKTTVLNEIAHSFLFYIFSLFLIAELTNFFVNSVIIVENYPLTRKQNKDR